ncbi:putative gcn5-related n-acetyltransferase [Triangularia verruculosa]|uniref:Gcn5-related n-acetyltransferase n=1 Tax=Triangularia verruculosa TaxID=2587418 RepID=A0AAN6X620_9PEZI|nr:putative gcn5-related n-acetyltransferase [Triangularia verruculosa]
MIPKLLQVADEVHPDLPESGHVFTERVQLFPKGCLTLANEDKVYGYAIFHPIRHAQPPPLDSLLSRIPKDADQYYIHDVAILPEFCGHGHAAKGIDILLQVASRYPTTSLVSVYNTEPFWRRYGFKAETIDAGLWKKIRKYGDDAVYMSRRNAAVYEKD